VAPGKTRRAQPPPRTSTTLFLQVVAFAADVEMISNPLVKLATLRGTVEPSSGGGVVHTGANTATLWRILHREGFDRLFDLASWQFN
jgi:hypothetical protein